MRNSSESSIAQREEPGHRPGFRVCGFPALLVVIGNPFVF